MSAENKPLLYDDLPGAVRNAVGVHEGLRRLGFPASEIYAASHDDDVLVILRTQNREVAMRVGSVEGLTPERLAAYWERVGEAMRANVLPGEDFQRMYAESPAMTNSVRFVAEIVSRGVKLPRAEEIAKIRLNESN